MPIAQCRKESCDYLQIIAKMDLGLDLSLPPKFDDCKETTAFKDAVVPAGEVSDFYAIYENNRFSDEEWQQIAEGKTKVLLYGQISYKGALWRKYVMNFGFL